MADINLLPWREALYKKTLQRTALGFGLVLLVVLGIAYFYMQDHQQRFQLKVRNEMQSELARLSKNMIVPQKKKAVAKLPVVSRSSAVVKPSLRIQTVHLQYAKAVDLAMLFRDKSNALLSRRGKLTVDPRTNLLWFEDSAPQLQKIMRFIKQLDVPAPQVLIEARLVTMNQESARDLGVRLGLIAPPASAENHAPTSPERLGINLPAAPLAASAAFLALSQASFISQRLLDVELSALESHGRAKIIASPRLITSNQMPALIESGEDIPYQEFGPNGTTSVSFKKAVLRLQVTPQLTAPQELMMALVINQDSDSGKRVQGVPIIATKAIETNILVRNRQTIVLGGIYQEDRNHQVDAVPGLGDLPIIGKLFQRMQGRIRHESLLIFITPSIIGS